MFALANKLFTVIVEDIRYCDGEIMDVCSRMDVTQSEGDLLDSNQSEPKKGQLVHPSKIELVLHSNNLFHNAPDKIPSLGGYSIISP